MRSRRYRRSSITGRLSKREARRLVWAVLAVHARLLLDPLKLGEVLSLDPADVETVRAAALRVAVMLGKKAKDAPAPFTPAGLDLWSKSLAHLPRAA